MTPKGFNSKKNIFTVVGVVATSFILSGVQAAGTGFTYNYIGQDWTGTCRDVSIQYVNKIWINIGSEIKSN